MWLVHLLIFVVGINTQQYFLPTQLVKQGFIRGAPLFNPAHYFRAVPQPPPSPVQPSRNDIQDQFTDIFNWSKDIANDPRFKGCPPPNISDISQASPKSSLFVGLNPQHRMASMRVRQLINGEKDLGKRVCLAGSLRDLPGMNPNVWIRGVFGAHLSNPELFELRAPPLVEVMPNIFLSREALQTAREQGNNPDQNARRCTVVDGRVGSDNGIENLLWYFREDLQVNNFHLNWHLIYPINGESKSDRQGELFYFSHHSHLARYHAERLSTGLLPITPLYIDHTTVIGEQYNSHLDDTNSGQTWTPRRSNILVQDTFFNNMMGAPSLITVANQSILIARVEDSIRRGGLLVPNGQTLILDSRTGVDFLGDLIEATVYTINGDYYGSFGFHNEGHVLLGFIEDPQNVTGLPPGVMAEVATAMRDPIFYRYHTAVDEVFDLHKQFLPPYQPDGGELPLRLEGVDITQFHVTQDDGTLTANRLTTFFNQNTFELSRGLDFQGSGVQGNVGACVTHLDHNPFTYTIYANRAPQSTGSGRTTVRIFMAPRFDHKGQRYSLLEQRKIFFMMDLFTVQLQPGLNLISRRSTESSLTISSPSSPQQTYCGCGWPGNLLIPRGTEAGMAFDLFVMLTNGDEDAVQPRTNNRQAQPGQCVPAPIYCGRMNDTYPDSRPIGYPFDRLPYAVGAVGARWWEQTQPRYVDSLEEYIKGINNMAAAEVTITHLGATAAVIESQGNNAPPTTTPAPVVGNQFTQDFSNQPNLIRRRRRKNRARLVSRFDMSPIFQNENLQKSNNFQYHFQPSHQYVSQLA